MRTTEKTIEQLVEEAYRDGHSRGRRNTQGSEDHDWANSNTRAALKVFMKGVEPVPSARPYCALVEKIESVGRTRFRLYFPDLPGCEFMAASVSDAIEEAGPFLHKWISVAHACHPKAPRSYSEIHHDDAVSRAMHNNATMAMIRPTASSF